MASQQGLSKPLAKKSGNKLVKIRGKNHLKCMTNQILESWGKECYADVTFICKSDSASSTGKCLKANKAVLAAGSRKLQLMLADTGDEDVTIFVPDSDFETTKLLLQYIYTGEVLIGLDSDVLESMIYDWEIGYPEITSVEPDSSTLTEISQTALRFSCESVKPSPKEIVVVEEEEVGLVIPKETEPEIPSVQLLTPTKETVASKEASPTVAPAISIVTDLEIPPVQLVTQKKQTATPEEATPAPAPATSKEIEFECPLVPSATPTKKIVTPKEASPTAAPAIPKEIELECPPVLPVAPENAGLATSALPKEIELGCPPVNPVAPETDGLTSALPKEIELESPTVQPMTPEMETETEGTESPAIPIEDELACPSIQPITPSKEIAATEIIAPVFFEETDPFCGESMFEEETALDAECVTTCLADSFLNDISPSKDIERFTIDHGYVKSDKEKVVVKFNPPPYELDVTSMDVPVYDSEEDKADYLLSKAFLTHEKSRTEELTEVLEELTDILKRHQIYAKHLIVPQNLRTKRRKVEKDNLEPRTPCEICGKEIRPSYMKEHIKTIHNNVRPYVCEQCGLGFAFPERLKNHLNDVHPSKPVEKTFVCETCSRTFKKKQQLTLHMTVHSGEKPFQCKYCDRRFRLKCILVKHQRTHTGEKPYLCSVCGLTFAVHTTYAVHLKKHENEAASRDPDAPKTAQMPFKCATCGMSFYREYSYLVHEAGHTGEEPKLPCRHCPGTFPTHQILKEHVRNYHGDVLFCCDQCTNYYTTRWALNNHKQVHKPQGNYPCSVCEKPFKLKSKLAQHMKNVHSTERPFKCRFCPKDFKVKRLWIEHDRLHTGERPFRCPHCPKDFRIQVQYSLHLRTHTGEKPFACSYCDKAFAARESLRMHIKTHTGNHIRCPICSKQFQTYAKLKIHEQIHKKIAEEKDLEGGEADELPDFMTGGEEEND